MITSAQNQVLKDIRRVQRRSRGETRFVAEGEDLLAAADAAGWVPETRLTAGVDVEPELLAKVSLLSSGTRTLAVYDERWALAATGPRCVALWGVGDPGNVGTILRGALAFGADCVAIGPGTADPFGSKAVRASMGAIFEVPVARVGSLRELPGPSIALVVRAGEPLEAVAGAGGTLVVGSERRGLPDDVLKSCDHVAHIPIASESLNAAMAATVGLYEMSKVGRG